MFWRLLELAFIIVAIMATTRLVMFLWRGPRKNNAQVELERAKEDARTAELERGAERIREQTRRQAGTNHHQKESK